jgi:putative sterol carrier protein
LVKFLTKEWLDALALALQAHEGFKGATATTELTLQFEVSDAPAGTEPVYLITLGGGSVQATAGPGASPDVTIVNSYETAVAVAKGELNTQMAFMTGKIKVSGNMTKLITNQAMLTQFASATAAMDVEY